MISSALFPQASPVVSQAVRNTTQQGSSLGLKSTHADSLIRQVQQGLPFHTLAALASASGLALAELAAVVAIPARTLARRKLSRQLSPDESERLLRISGVFENAVSLFEGDVTTAVAWLRSPKSALQNESPLAYSRTELGAQEVLRLIGRLEHGVFA